MHKSELENEWALLQDQFDSYEKFSLIIKLFSVGVLVFAFSCAGISLSITALLLILWLQDAIWKTFQARIESRLLQLETAIAASSDELISCQFNSQYLKTRPGTAGLLVEYFKQALRPTVAFPHIALFVLAIIELLN